MSIEGIKGAGMTYQGSAASFEQKVELQPKIEAGETVQVAQNLTKDTVAIDTKETSEENAGANQQTAQDQQNAKIKKAVNDINKRATNTEAIFGIHDATNRVTIKIVDKETKKVIKELPPEKTLDMIAKVWELAGILVDEKR